MAVIDDDCIADPEWLTVISAAFSGHDSPDVLTGRVLPFPPVGDRTYAVSTRTSEKRAEYVGKSLPCAIGSRNNFALKKDWFVRIGGCDKRLGPGTPAQGGVDMDLFYRLLRACATIRYEPEAVVYHERDTLAGRLAWRPMYGHAAIWCMLRALWPVRWKGGSPNRGALTPKAARSLPAVAADPKEIVAPHKDCAC